MDPDAQHLAGIDARGVGEVVAHDQCADGRAVARGDSGQRLTVGDAVEHRLAAMRRLAGRCRRRSHAKALSGVDPVRIGDTVQRHQPLDRRAVSGCDLAQRLAGLHDHHSIAGGRRQRAEPARRDGHHHGAGEDEPRGPDRARGSRTVRRTDRHRASGAWCACVGGEPSAHDGRLMLGGGPDRSRYLRVGMEYFGTVVWAALVFGGCRQGPPWARKQRTSVLYWLPVREWPPSGQHANRAIPITHARGSRDPRCPARRTAHGSIAGSRCERRNEPEVLTWLPHP